MLPRFTPAFFQPISTRPATPLAPAGSSAAASDAPARQPVVYSAAQYHSMEHFLAHPDFATFQTEFEALIDQLPRFAMTHAQAVTPPLSNAALARLGRDCATLKTHLFVQAENFFSDHKAMVYGNGKESFQTLNRLLGDDKIGVQQRLNILLELGTKMNVCAGGLLTGLQDAITQLSLSNVGLRGPAYRMKAHMTKQLILQHVQAHHAYSSGNEVHFINVYFNYLAKQLGLPEETDPMLSIAAPVITLELLEKCGASVAARMTPTRLAHAMGEAYLDLIKGAAASTGVALNGPTPLAEAWTATKGIDTVKEAMLDPEYGEVEQKLYVRTVPKPDDAESDDYQLVSNPVLLAKHFVTRMRDEELVEFDNAFTLKANAHDGADLMQLGDLFWLRTKDGSCDEIEARNLFAVSPQEVLSNPELAPENHYAVLRDIARHVLEAGKDVRENLYTGAVRPAWLMQFAEIFTRQQAQPGQAKDWITPVLMLAARHGANRVLEALHTAGADMEARDRDGKTALMAAAEAGSEYALGALLEIGVNKERQDAQGNTALLLATPHEMNGTAGMLFNADVNLNTANKVGRTPLMEAARHGRTFLLNCLIDAGAHPNRADASGNTAAIFAARKGHSDELRILIDAGANLNCVNRQGATAAIDATRAGHAEALNVLSIGGANLDFPDAAGKPPVLIAAGNGHLEVLKVLIAGGANINAVDRGLRTAAMFAVGIGHIEMLEALIDAGADIEHADATGYTAVQIAAEIGHAEVLKLLIDKGANIHHINLHGINAAFLAAHNGHAEVLKYLIENEVNINARTTQGDSVVMAAAWRGHAEVLKILIGAGADIIGKNASGQTVAMLAERQGHREMLRAAVNVADANGDTALMRAARDGRTAQVQALIDAGADLGLSNAQDDTAAILAARHGHDQVLLLLKEAGVDLETIPRLRKRPRLN